MFDMSDSEIQVIAAVLIRQGRFLVCQRPAHKRHGNLWEFPGGKLEPGESLLSAATRELSEELDLTVTAIGTTRFIAHDPGSNFVINFVDVEASGTPNPLEHSSVNWCAPEELLTLPLAPSDLLFAKQIARDSTHGHTVQATHNQNPQ